MALYFVVLERDKDSVLSSMAGDYLPVEAFVHFFLLLEKIHRP